MLATGSDEKTFPQLEQDNEEEERSKAKEKGLSLHRPPSPKDADREMEHELYLRKSGSPLEASPADEVPQTKAVPQPQASSLSKMALRRTYRRPYSVHEFVIEPDSQGSSQCTTASQELDTELDTKQPAESPETPEINDTQNPLLECEVTKPVRKHSNKCHAR